ncbi:hypothetical protein DQ04_01561090 [Trypanosoma grayi]|uniref:hypothetical protein n=1 Tax=Trypanosoma grayi TaxID=71804 RepID=UPI0004F4BB80|nr:hypothetical protein DQ04_01561090 [Trypanosoma grayi]KEG12642.1 hypothetical protein DQ04_01561090 [Trypanosoma grayi]
MVRQVLLASEPLTPDELVRKVRNAHEKEPCESATTPSPTSPLSSAAAAKVSPANVAEASGRIEYLRSHIMPPAMVRRGATGGAGGGPCPVESTVRLLLAVDSQFRVSPGGFVCYPNLPSLCLASNTADRNERWMRTAWRIVSPEEGSCNSNKNNSGVNDATVESVELKEVSGWNYMLSFWWVMLDIPDEDNGPKASSKVAAAMAPGSTAHERMCISQSLVDHWISTFDQRDLPLLLRNAAPAGSSGDGDQSQAWTQRRGPPPPEAPLEFRESVEGNDCLRRWCVEAREGVLGETLVGAPLLTQSSSAMMQIINEQIGLLFGHVVGTPITLGRLSALIQWESLPFAAHYQSLLHFLLVYTANPSVVQMERRELRRREAHKQWTELLWARIERERCRHLQPHYSGERHSLSRRYASREYVEDPPVEKENAEAIDDDGSSNSSVPHEQATWAKEVSSAQYLSWVQCSSGLNVNPRPLEVCRCVFLQPAAMEPLEVATRTPSEVAEALTKQKKKGKNAEEGATNDMVVFSTTRYVFVRRIFRVVRLWWVFEGQHVAVDKEAGIRITVQRLCQICLWEHEYGAPAAANMMLQYLQLLIANGVTEVQLLPPPSASASEAGCWLVALRSYGESSRRAVEGGNRGE